jgi:Zn-dependent peptidase ImmA (M78 family)
MAAAARQEIALGPIDPLDCGRYAAHIGIAMLNFDELTALSPESKRQLLQADSDSWSGMTIKEGSVTAVLLNPTHAIERQRNTLMHEASHILLKHVPTRVDFGPGGILLVSEYAEEDEDEADWLAGALLLPRTALASCRDHSMTNAQIAQRYCTSTQLSDWRIRMTGIDVQRRRAAGR